MSKNDYAPVGHTIGDETMLTSFPELELDPELSFLDLVILSLLNSSPMTGYVLKKSLVKQYRLKASYGTLYPRLKTLQKEGILKDSENLGKFASRSTGTNYELTPLGRKILDQNLRRFDGLLQKIRANDPRQSSF
ncbi:MAG TPA: PadR family transcriptional regulator [Nitrososphaerales archaeon]|nr:PadR family transcriptional regulator [Nitrososphaerales archaeon]